MSNLSLEIITKFLSVKMAVAISLLILLVLELARLSGDDSSYVFMKLRLDGAKV